MKNGKLLKTALSTLLHSWGSDTPPEAVWAYNEMIGFINKEYNKNFSEISEEYTAQSETNMNELFEFLNSSECNEEITIDEDFERDLDVNSDLGSKEELPKAKKKVTTDDCRRLLVERFPETKIEDWKRVAKYRNPEENNTTRLFKNKVEHISNVTVVETNTTGEISINEDTIQIEIKTDLYFDKDNSFGLCEETDINEIVKEINKKEQGKWVFSTKYIVSRYNLDIDNDSIPEFVTCLEFIYNDKIAFVFYCNKAIAEIRILVPKLFDLSSFKKVNKQEYTDDDSDNYDEDYDFQDHFYNLMSEEVIKIITSPIVNCNEYEDQDNENFEISNDKGYIINAEHGGDWQPQLTVAYRYMNDGNFYYDHLSMKNITLEEVGKEEDDEESIENEDLDEDSFNKAILESIKKSNEEAEKVADIKIKVYYRNSTSEWIGEIIYTANETDGICRVTASSEDAARNAAFAKVGGCLLEAYFDDEEKPVYELRELNTKEENENQCCQHNNEVEEKVKEEPQNDFSNLSDKERLLRLRNKVK